MRTALSEQLGLPFELAGQTVHAFPQPATLLKLDSFPHRLAHRALAHLHEVSWLRRAPSKRLPCHWRLQVTAEGDVPRVRAAGSLSNGTRSYDGGDRRDRLDSHTSDRQPERKRDDRVRVNAIVGSFKLERSQSSDPSGSRSTVVLVALQQALWREATTSRQNAMSLQLAQSNDVGATETSSTSRPNSSARRARAVRNSTSLGARGRAGRPQRVIR